MYTSDNKNKIKKKTAHFCVSSLEPDYLYLLNLFLNFSGGIPITVTGENVDSVQEPVMVVVIVRVDVTVSSYDQVNTITLPMWAIGKSLN